jgi:hypothetical protein
MADQDDLLSRYADRTAIQSDTEFLLENFAKIETALTALSKLKISIGDSTTLPGIGDGAKKAKDGIDVLTAATEKLLTSQGGTAKQLAEVKVLQTQVTKANTDAAKEALGLVGAYDRLNKQYQTAAKAAKDAAAAGELNSEQVAALAKTANDLQTKLKNIDASVGQFNRNVGNYAGSLGGAFAVLQNELQQIQAKIKQTDSGDAGFANLVKEEQLLVQLTENLNQGFSSTKQELRAYQEAAKQLGLEVGLTNKTFISFTDQIGNTKNELDDIQKAINYKASDTKFLDGAISAVTGLAGAYGAAQGAASLFGADESELQKQMVKLQAVMSIVQGLQAVGNALQTESAALQLLLAARTSLLNTALAVQNALFATRVATVTATIVTDEAATVANTELAASLTAEATAATAATTATTAMAAAAAAEAAAAATGTAATSSFATALASTGVGAIILGIAAAAYLAYQKFKDWTASTILNSKAQKELADALVTELDALNDINKLQDTAGKSSLDALQRELDLTEKSGQNQYKILAIKQKIADKNAEIADSKYTQALAAAESKYIKDGLTGVDALHKAQTDFFEDLTAKSYKAAQQQKTLADLKSLTDKQRRDKDISEKDIDRAKDLADQADAEKKLAQARYDYFTKGEIDKTNSEHEQENIRTDIAKLSADERRKFALTSVELEAAAVQNKNAIILASDASTQAQRLAAIKSNAAAERAIADAQANDVKNNPSSTATDIAIAEKQRAEKVLEIRRNLAKDINDLNLDYAKRDRLAVLQEVNGQLADNAKNNDLIVSNDKKSFDQRLQALTDSLLARRAILQNQYTEDTNQLGLTEEQRRAIEKKYAIDSADLVVEYGQKQLDLYKVNQEQITAIVEKESRKRADTLSAEGSAKLSQLNSDLLQGNINFNKYTKERALLESKNNIDSLAAQAETDFARVNSYKKGTAERAAAEKDLAETTKKLGDGIIANDELIRKQRVDDILKVKAYGDQVLDLVNSAVDASVTAKKNQLQEQSDAIDKNTQKEIDAVNASVASEQDKAAKIAVINAKAQAQKEEIAAKERKLDQQKAEATKLKAIFDIILATASNIAKATNLTERLEAAGIGAAELAIAYATPVPKFKTGRESGDGIIGIVGDGGRREVMYSPDMKQAVLTPAVDTLTYIPKDWGIAPSIEEFQERAFAMAARPISSMPVLAENSDKLIHAMMHELNGLKMAVMNKREIYFNWDNGELQIAVKNGVSTMKYLNGNL